MSITIKKINKSYNKQKALVNISFEIKKGEIVGLLGSNGAGKSTLMRIISGYLKQDNGEIKICNLDTNNNIKIKSKIGYLPENNPLYMNMYIKEYLFFIANIYKIINPENRIKEIIKKTGLTIEKSKKIKKLSKGYKQRLGLAAALLNSPEILILDEPTTGLDPNQLIEIRSLIKDIGKNKTVLLSTHIMQEVEKICTRIIIINKGKIVDDQLVSNLKKNNINLEDHFCKLTT